jgi:hypothetical protein
MYSRETEGFLQSMWRQWTLYSRQAKVQLRSMQTYQNVSASVESNPSRDSALDRIAPVPVESTSPTNQQVNQPETELNCIDQLMQDHIASCLERSIDPFPSESLQGNVSHESMYVQLPRLSNPV